MAVNLHTPILIIGAGPAGCSAALFLAKRGIPSVMVDKADFPRDKICGDALSGKVVEVLNKLNPQLRNELEEVESAIGSWGVTFVAPNGQALRMPFSTRKTTEQKAPGYISKRIDFDYWLYQKAKSSQLIKIIAPCQLRKFERHPTGITAYGQQGEVIKANLVIACDGAYSTFAKDIAQLVTEPAHNCFGLRAYYTNVTGLDHENFIELHFIKNILPGYFWVFPLPGGYANVGIGMRADKMEQKGINLKKAFEDVVANHPAIAARFAGAQLQGGVKQFGLPLGSKKRELAGDNYLLCGDAAQLIDPFTGEGIGNALLSGMLAAAQAAECIAADNFSAAFNSAYTHAVYNRLWDELQLSYRLQQLVNYPWLFNLVVRKANSNKTLQETISCMFEDVDLRGRLKDPSFYFKLLFS